MFDHSEIFLISKRKKQLHLDAKQRVVTFNDGSRKLFYKYDEIFDNTKQFLQRSQKAIESVKDTDHIMFAFLVNDKGTHLENGYFIEFMKRFFGKQQLFNFNVLNYEDIQLVNTYKQLQNMLSEKVIRLPFYLRTNSSFNVLTRVTIVYINAEERGYPTPLINFFANCKNIVFQTCQDPLFSQVNKIYFLLHNKDPHNSHFLASCFGAVSSIFKQFKTEVMIYRHIRNKHDEGERFYRTMLIRVPFRKTVAAYRREAALLENALPVVHCVTRYIAFQCWYQRFQHLRARQLLEESSLARKAGALSEELEKPRGKGQRDRQGRVQGRKKARKAKKRREEAEKCAPGAAEDGGAAGDEREGDEAPDVRTQEHTGAQTACGAETGPVEVNLSQMGSNARLACLRTMFRIRTTRVEGIPEVRPTALQDRLVRVSRSAKLARADPLVEDDGAGGQADPRGAKAQGQCDELYARLAQKYKNYQKYTSSLLRDLRQLVYAEVEPPYPLFLNTYNLLGNNFLLNIGLGFYHSAIQILGLELAFGGHEYDETGVYAIKPCSLGGASFLRSIYIDHCYKSKEEIAEILLDAAIKWKGNQYDILRFNCNDFSAEMCQKLCNCRIPRYINRAARVGQAFVRKKLVVKGKMGDVVGFQGSLESGMDAEGDAQQGTAARSGRQMMLG